MSDKDIERRRYEERARATLERRGIETQRGSGAVPPTLRRPYLAYEAAVRSVLQARCRVLEIGAGTGSHTRVLTEGSAPALSVGQKLAEPVRLPDRDSLRASRESA